MQRTVRVTFGIVHVPRLVGGGRNSELWQGVAVVSVSVSLRSPYCLFASVLIAGLACAPKVEDSGSHPDPVASRPPPAEVVARLIDIGPIGPDDRAGTASLSEPQLVEVGPKGVASDSTSITFRFSEPMDHEGPLPTVVVEPHVEGSLRWTDPYRLSLSPWGQIEEAQTYTVRASGTARSREGVLASVDATWTFETTRPTVTVDTESYDGGRLEPEAIHWRNRFNVSVSHLVSSAALRRATEVYDVSGPEPRRLAFRLKGTFERDEPRTTTEWDIIPRGHWPAGATVEARIKDTLVTSAGPLPTGRTVIRRLRTRDGVAATIECEEQLAEGCPPGYLSLNFDAPVSHRYLRNIRVSPRPSGLSIEPGLGTDKTMDNVFINGKFEPGTTYRVRIKKGLKDVHGQTLAGSAVKSILTVPPPPLLQLSASGTLLDVERASIGVESRLVEDATLSVSMLDDAALAELVALPPLDRYLPTHGTTTHHKALDLTPGGSYGWDAREVDLSKALGAEHFAAYVELSPGALAAAAKDRAHVVTTHSFVQRTDLGAVFGRAPARSFVRVASLATAKPLAGAHVTVYDAKTKPPTKLDTFGPTDGDGFVLLPPHDSLPMSAVLVVNRDSDRFAMRVRDSSGHGGRRARGKAYDVGVLLPDRNLYQPGERMRVMGWVAQSVADGGTGLAGSGTRSVDVRLRIGNETIAKSTVRAKRYGKFWATLELPDSTPLGTMKVEATLGRIGGDDTEDDNARSTSERAPDFSASVRVREFEAPAFDVKLATDDADLGHDETVQVSARAAYLHGMALPIKRARLQNTCSGATYQPPTETYLHVLTPTVDPTAWSQRVTVPAAPEHRRGVLKTPVDLTPLDDGHPYRCTFSLGVQDAALQEISTDTKIWVHPSRYLLVAPLPDSYFVKGTTARWSGFSMLHDGSAGSPSVVKIKIEVLKRDAEGHLVSRSRTKTCTLDIKDESGGTCSWTPRKAGEYEATFTAVVDGVELERTERFSAYDPPPPAKVARTSPPPTRVSFAVETPSTVEPGDDVVVGIWAPEDTASGFLVDVHAGIRSLHAFQLQDHHAELTLRADDAWVPRTYLDTFVTRPKGPTWDLPQVYRTSDNVQMGAAHRALDVEISNPAEASVRSSLPIEVHVADPTGQAVPNAHVSLWAVDEGVLMLRDWHFPDFPMSLLSDRGNEATYFDDYSSLRHPYQKRLDPYEPGYATGYGGGSASGSGSGSGYGSISGRGGAKARTVRRNFDPAPIFVGDVVTNDDGVATLKGILPDNLTTFRIAAVATAELGETGAFARAGRAESRVRVTQDIAVRALLPNVLRPGDTAELAALVDNLAAIKGDLDVELEVRGPPGVLELKTDATVRRSGTDAPQERAAFTVHARKPGTVHIRVFASLEGEGRTLSDASELTLEIIPERTLRHASAVYGSFDAAEPRAIELAPPAGASALTTSVDLYTSLLGGYAGNVDSLVDYPYGCVEQTSSRLIPLIALHGLEDYPLGIEDTSKFIDEGLRKLSEMQLRSGAFGYWPASTTPHVYGTAYAAWVLSRAKKAGYDISPPVLDGALDFLEKELQHYGARGTPTIDQEIRAAMALHALAEAGRSVPSVRDALLERSTALPAFARALLALALHHEQPDDPRLDALLTSLTDNVEERDSIARSRATPIRYTRYFDSPVRTDALLLLTLAELQPESPLIEKLARGLSRARDEGSIRNTQENAYALLAMSAYAGLREATPPALDVHTWLDNDPFLDVRFDGRDLAVHRATARFDAATPPRVTLDPQGEGRLYYRVGMGWTQSARETKAHAAGLAVSRRLHDEAGDYGPDRPMKAGDTAWLEVHVTADMRQRYVALDIPIPAGLEAVDTSLGRTGAVLLSGGRSKGARSLAYNHRELRRDRILVFADDLESGDHRFAVPVRATHEGTYSFPPARAEAMYSPEVYGHSDGGALVVSPAVP